MLVGDLNDTLTSVQQLPTYGGDCDGSIDHNHISVDDPTKWLPGSVLQLPLDHCNSDTVHQSSGAITTAMRSFPKLCRLPVLRRVLGVYRLTLWAVSIVGRALK